MATPFVNWARTVRTTPTAWAAPASEDEVVALVRDVRARGGRLRVSGARHSWSPIAGSDDVQVELTRMDRVLSIDRDARTITVLGGCRLHTISAALAAAGLALPILGSIAQQTISGAIATGTHGSSLRHGNLATLVRGLRLVDGTGEVHVLRHGDPHLDAARVHLGLLGVVTEVTLTCEPAFGLVETSLNLPFDEACDRLTELADGHEYVKLWWLPPLDQVLVRTYARTAPDVSRGRTEAWREVVSNDVLFPLLLGAGRLVPSLIPHINRTVFATDFAPGTRQGPSAAMFGLRMPPRHRETEVAVPLAAGPDLLRGLRDVVLGEGLRLDFIQEVRFVKGDTGWLSPAFGRDTVQLGVYGTFSPDIPRAFAALHRLADRHDGRPHWGKALPDVAGLHTRWPQAPQFRRLADALDPSGVFRSPTLDLALGR